MKTNTHLQQLEISKKWSRLREGPYWRWFKLLLGLALSALAFCYLWRQIDSLEALLAVVAQARLEPMLASLTLTIVCALLGGIAWYFVMRVLDYDLGTYRCLNIHVTSSLGKYIPGSVWQVVGKAYLTHRQGPILKMAWLGLLIELILSYATGLVLGTLFLPLGKVLPVVGAISPVVRGLIVLAYLAFLGLSVSVARYVIRKRASSQVYAAFEGMQSSALWSAGGILLVSWVLLGLAFAFTLQAFDPGAFGAWPSAIAATALSYVASLVVPFVPVGMGIREAVIVTALAPAVSSEVAITAALASRVVLLLAEALAFAGTWLVGQIGGIDREASSE